MVDILPDTCLALQHGYAVDFLNLIDKPPRKNLNGCNVDRSLRTLREYSLFFVFLIV